MNDYSVHDINWIRRFATFHATHLNENIVFCIEFTDLLDLHIFNDYDKSQSKSSSEFTLQHKSKKVA